MEMMQLIREADDLIRKVVTRYNGLYTQQGKVSQIELDLMLDEIRQLYEKFKVIGQLNLAPPAVQVEKPAYQPPLQPLVSQSQPAVEKHKEPEEIKHVPLVEKPAEPQAELVHQYIEPEVEKVVETPPVPTREDAFTHDENPPEVVAEVSEKPAPEPVAVIPEPLEPKEEPKPKPPVAKAPKPSVQPEKSRTTLADTFRKEQISLSESIAPSESEASLSSRLQAQPIANLKAAIGLNERFNFITDLFANDLLGYDEAIKQLNNASGREAALELLALLREKYQWSDSNAALPRFTDFVHRRFM